MPNFILRPSSASDQAEILKEKKRYEAEAETLNKAKQAFEEKKKKENELFQERLEAQLKTDRKVIEEKVKAIALADNAEVM